jgi:hypothetical protein
MRRRQESCRLRNRVGLFLLRRGIYDARWGGPWRRSFRLPANVGDCWRSNELPAICAAATLVSGRGHYRCPRVQVIRDDASVVHFAQGCADSLTSWGARAMHALWSALDRHTSQLMIRLYHGCQVWGLDHGMQVREGQKTRWTRTGAPSQTFCEEDAGGLRQHYRYCRHLSNEILEYTLHATNHTLLKKALLNSIMVGGQPIELALLSQPQSQSSAGYSAIRSKSQ